MPASRGGWGVYIAGEENESPHCCKPPRKTQAASHRSSSRTATSGAGSCRRGCYRQSLSCLAEELPARVGTRSSYSSLGCLGISAGSSGIAEQADRYVCLHSIPSVGIACVRSVESGCVFQRTSERRSGRSIDLIRMVVVLSCEDPTQQSARLVGEADRCGSVWLYEVASGRLNTPLSQKNRVFALVVLGRFVKG